MRPFTFLVLSTAHLAVVSANCLYGTVHHPRSLDETVPVSTFGYTGLQGPLNWAALNSAYFACSTGTTQSPISINESTTPIATDSPVMTIGDVDYAVFENLGSTLEVVINGSMIFGGVNYTLQQFHFHTPSEHRINEEYFPLEMHMVHDAEDGSVVVLAIPFDLMEDGSTTELLTSVISNIDEVRTPGTATETGPLDFTALVDAIHATPLFQYSGSLTTPPCTQGVTFLVASEPMPLNVSTYNTFKSVIKFNSRYTQNSLGQVNLLENAAQRSSSNKRSTDSADGLYGNMSNFVGWIGRSFV